MIGQVLSREVIDSQLKPLAAEAKRAADDGHLPEEFGHLTKAELGDAAKLLAARSGKLERTPAEDGPAAGRRAPGSPIDDHAFIPRDPVASIVQSALEEGLRREGRVRRLAPDDEERRGGETAPVTDEFVDGQPPELEETSGKQRRIFRPFEIPSDVRWVSCKIAEGIRLWKGKHEFVDRPASGKLENKATLLLVGDWGTGIKRARKVSNAMRVELEDAVANGRDVHVIHLGDVYYSGFAYEYRDRVLPNWPVWPEEVERIGSWSLIGNHDMYSGGWGYWNDLLTDPRFAGHEGSSHFQLENDDWKVFGLDTGWEEEHGSLPGKQLAWLEHELTGKKRSLLLSHHQLFSVYGKGSEKLRERVLPLLADHPVDAWFWGHEHRCMTFSEHEGVRYGCCLGHGGVPVYQYHQPEDPVPAPGIFEYRDILPLGLLGLEHWALFGFAVVELDGPDATVRYVNEVGFTYWEREPLPP